MFNTKPNELFNSLVQKIIQKTIHVGFVTMKVCVYDAILAFNEGAKAKLMLNKTIELKESHLQKLIDQTTTAEKKLKKAQKKQKLHLKKYYRRYRGRLTPDTNSFYKGNCNFSVIVITNHVLLIFNQFYQKLFFLHKFSFFYGTAKDNILKFLQ